MLQYAEGNAAAADATFRNAQAQRPNDLRLACAYARYLARQRKNPADARVFLEPMANKYPTDGRVQEAWGDVLWAAGQQAQARSAWETAVRSGRHVDIAARMRVQP